MAMACRSELKRSTNDLEPCRSWSGSRTRLPAGLSSFWVWQATQLRSQDRLDVAEVLDVLDALREAQAGLVVLVPFLAGLVVLLGGQQRRLLGQVEDLVVGLGRRRCP